nr:MAG TPA: hypothetical protein [Caudoviricetes sp.]
MLREVIARITTSFWRIKRKWAIAKATARGLSYVLL